MLATEELAPGFSADELAALTDGYSGSDLKALCVAAAYRPIRELLAAEDAARGAAEAAGRAEEQAGREAGQQQQPAAAAAAAAAAVVPMEQDGGGAAGARAAAAPAPGTSADGGGGGGQAGAAACCSKEGGGGGVALRPLRLADFKAAMKQVGPSVAGDTRVMEELKAWNERFGEGGNRRDASTLTYFL
jgi:SpoVK/Ycf46/Vps4 family AAA+-type ATPase